MGGRVLRRRRHFRLPRRQPPGKLWSREAARAALSALAATAALVIASEDELDLVTCGDSEDAAAEALLRRGVQQVVVKRGAAGASA